MPGILLTFQRDNWLSNLVPRSTLGRYLGQRLAIKSGFYLGAFFLLGYLLDTFGGGSLAAFALVLTLALVTSLVDFIIFTHMYEPDKKGDDAPKQEPQTLQFGLFDFLGELKEKKLDNFIMFSSFFYLTVGLSSPLYVVYMLQERHFTYLNFAVIISAEYLARVVSMPFWGRFADKAGNIRVLSIVSRIIPAIPICWLFCSNIGYLAFVQTVSGICWGAYDLCTQTYLYKVAPKPKKLRYIVYTRCLVLFCMALGGLMGAYLVKGIFFTFGSRLLSIFLISGIFEALVVMYMIPKLVDLAVSYGRPPAPPAVDLEKLAKVIASRRGLFYQRERQAEDAVAQIQRMGEAAGSDISQYAGRRKWATPEKPRPQIKELTPLVKPVNSARRLSQYREAMVALAEMKPDVSPHEIEQNVERLKLRYGLEPLPEAAAARPEKALSHHGIDQNMERLKLRYGLNRQPEAVVAHTEKVPSHHGIDQDMERLKLRYGLNRQPEAVAARAEKVQVTSYQEPKANAGKVKSRPGLYHDQTGWAGYMKETLDAILQDRQGQKVPVMVSSWSGASVPGATRTRDQLLRRTFRDKQAYDCWTNRLPPF